MATSSELLPVDQGKVAAEFVSFARQIDHTVHPSLEFEKLDICMKNEMAKALGLDEMVTVGSAVDGSKVNIPGDIGDIDVLLVSKEVVLDQSLFDYSERYPAFLHIRNIGKHTKYFKNIQLIDGKYIPVSVLKSLQSRFFVFNRFQVNGITMPSVIGDFSPETNNVFNMIRNSAVGIEKVKLDTEQLETLSLPSSKPTDSLTRFSKMACPIINTCMDMSKMGFFKPPSESYSDENQEQPERRDISKTLHRFVDFVAKQGSDNDDNQKQPERTDVLKTVHMLIDFMTKQSSEDAEKQSSVRSEKQDCEKTHILKIPVSAPRNIQTDSVCHSASNHDPTIHAECDSDLSTSQSNKRFMIYERQTDSIKDSDKVQKHGLSKEIQFNKQSSADFVPAFPFEGWPTCANEWLTRKRKWPSKEIVESIRHTECHVVAKRPLLPDMNGDPKNEDHSPEHDKQDPYFRVSFSKCELVLSGSLSEPQLLCWRVLKAFQKAYLGSEPRVLASYHWKNVAFWLFEITGPEFWTEESVLDGVCRALDFMMVFLSLRFVPSYFVQTCNLIEGCCNDLIYEVYKQILQVRKNPVAYLKRFIKSPPSPEQYTVQTDKLRYNLSEENLNEHHSKFGDAMSAFLRQLPQSLSSDDDDCKRMRSGLLNALEMMLEILGEIQTSDSVQVSHLTELKPMLDKYFESTPDLQFDIGIDIFALLKKTIMPENQKSHSQYFIQELKNLFTGDDSLSIPSRTFAMLIRCFLAITEHKLSEQRSKQRKDHFENCQDSRADVDNTDDKGS